MLLPLPYFGLDLALSFAVVAVSRGCVVLELQGGVFDAKLVVQVMLNFFDKRVAISHVF